MLKVGKAVKKLSKTMWALKVTTRPEPYLCYGAWPTRAEAIDWFNAYSETPDAYSLLRKDGKLLAVKVKVTEL